MTVELRLEGEFTVLVDNRPVPDPPNQVVATLLAGLAHRGGEWSSRTELAELLYPDSDAPAAANAFRQSLHRLKKWVGEGLVEEHMGCIRLAPGSVTIASSPRQRLSPAMLAPGITHPWMDAIRRESLADPQPNTRRSKTSLNVLSFYTLVDETADVDRDTARGLLVAGTKFINDLSVDEAFYLLNRTKPDDRHAPNALEHVQMRAHVYEMAGLVPDALAGFTKTYRMAARQKRRKDMARSAAMSAFTAVEAGRIDEAHRWICRLEDLKTVASFGLLMANARSTFLWNIDRVDEALAAMRDAENLFDSADRAQRVHYWTNRSVLAAEAGEFDDACESQDRAQTISVPELDSRQLLALQLSPATRLMKRGLMDESAACFRALIEKTEEFGLTYLRWYASEGLAECHARAGDLKRAAATWEKAESARLAGGMKLNPRLLARKALCSSRL